MKRERAVGWGVGLCLGIVLGLSVAGVLPQTPVHAVATHGQDSFAIATGPIQEDIEGFFFLDYLTGDLKVAVLNFQTGKFTSLFTYNVMNDLVEGNPSGIKFLMVTGMVDFRRAIAGQIQPARSVVYVAEATSGNVAVYGVPWNTPAATAGRPQKGSLVLLDKQKFRTAPVREE